MSEGVLVPGRQLAISSFCVFSSAPSGTCGCNVRSVMCGQRVTTLSLCLSCETVDEAAAAAHTWFNKAHGPERSAVLVSACAWQHPVLFTGRPSPLVTSRLLYSMHACARLTLGVAFAGQPR